jgi:basic membrane protein A
VAGSCGLGAIDAAKEKSMQAIGVDADQSYLGQQIITSALKKVDVAVFDAIKSVQDNTYKGGGDVIASLKTNGVGIGKISAAGQKYADQVKKIQQQILDGSITPPDTVGSGT